MNIQEAIKEAVEQKRGIARESWRVNSMWAIPTNTNLCMILLSKDEIASGRWEPNADDLIANDWSVFG